MQHNGWILVGLSLCLVAAGKSAEKTKHRHHHAHEHGVATVDIVVDGKTAAIEFRSPSEGLFGFEHTPSSDKDKKIVEEQTAKLKAEASSLVRFPDGLGCKTSVEELTAFVIDKDEHDHKHEHKDEHKDEHAKEKVEGTHSEFHAKFLVTCTKDISKATIAFGFSKVFPGVETIKVQALSATTQVGKTIKNDKGTISI